MKSANVLPRKIPTKPTMRSALSILPFYLRIDELRADNKRKTGEEENGGAEECSGEEREERATDVSFWPDGGRTYPQRDFCKRRDEPASDDYFVDLRD